MGKGKEKEESTEEFLYADNSPITPLSRGVSNLDLYGDNLDEIL